jgi:Zn finger protein HypA/HybF involved in hydrogenase expression
MIMAVDIFDNLPIWGLDEFENFRNSKYRFLYLCRNCARSFDSDEALNKCKFCGQQVMELRTAKKERESWKSGFKKRTMYKYFCPTCERSFVTNEKMAVCNRCRTDYLHVHTWNMLRRRDKFYIKLNKAMKNVFREKEGKAERKKFNFSFNLQRANKQEELPTY